ncbi:MAG TPA: peptidoglycan DD-metalloendopeptidase family protein [Gammaproteobacteria bacterium]|nr:peptidoglycan DD-metalloendopeptidase family protein [Gammaproteobacteria bacterium]
MCNRIFLLLCLTFCLASCGGPSHHFAPVSNGWKSREASQIYRVQPTDTLYSVAFRYGLDVNKLAKANAISPPYHILVGQTLKLLPDANDSTLPISAPAPVLVVAKPVPTTPVAATPIIPVEKQPVATGPIGKWAWPAQGKIIQGFSAAYAGNKGLDIAGKLGDPVRATASGRVVYCGTGLRSYGLLIIVKHNAKYLSAYAHNSKAFVKEGDKVSRGQIIAKMGSSDATRVMLHFEIRQLGKPVDPLQLLPPRKG